MGTPAGTAIDRPDEARVVVLVSGGPEGPRPRVHPADEPLLLADDLAAVRGDGCFETLLVVGGRPAKPERHLARLARSAAALGLTGPSESAWRAGMDLAAREWDTRTEAMLRLVLSRGPERGGQETAYITVAPVSGSALRARAEGIAVTALGRGYASDAAGSAPWLLIGSKTLSYATNMAALRHAAAGGFDDVVYLSSDGERLLLTDLVSADAMWLLSSVTLYARVRRIDDTTLPGGDPGIDVAGMVDRAVGRA